MQLNCFGTNKSQKDFCVTKASFLWENNRRRCFLVTFLKSTTESSEKRGVTRNFSPLKRNSAAAELWLLKKRDD